MTASVVQKKRIYLIHPKPLHADQYGAELIPRTVSIADAAMVTVAALAPADKFDFKLCEEFVEEVDFDYPADFVGITGKYGQGQRMIEIARAFRARGIPVIFGGPHASLAPEEVRAECDVLVKGELEAIAEQFFEDLYTGRYQREYIGLRGAIQASPVPRWDLYPNDRALFGTLQTSRGCPFECEFCDVIVYLGRKQSHKTVAQVLAELEVLHRLGYRRVMLADDNLTVYRARARELLRALAEWNRAASEPISFITQASIDISTDDEMLELLAQASVRNVFIGIETVNQDALKETKKRQNVGVDMVDRTERFARHGIVVGAGIIVGFDHDTPQIFQQVLDFAMRSPIPIFTVVPLYAAHGTPLREKMAAAGRLHCDVATATMAMNIMPAQMSSEQLAGGVHWLAKQLLDPEQFATRLLRMIELFPSEGQQPVKPTNRGVVTETLLACHSLLDGSPGTASALRRILKALKAKPSAREGVLGAVSVWAQRIHLMRRWEATHVQAILPELLAASSGPVAQQHARRGLPLVP
jgi:radical SAM superfamily enzyme YgiQ (UPF0313 family)